LRAFIHSDGRVGDFTPEQSVALSYQTITYVLGSHFNCPPHSWDDQPPEKVHFLYNFVKAVQEKQSEEMERARKDAGRYNAGGKRNKGQPLRTTSDSATLTDSFDLMNARLREQDG
jgi:hypothetical protein|tara:strand:+ start:3222 stop:3569 length:348 start_codon:yes stop_codon:yes gene_type:complete